MTTNEERVKVLKMVQEGKISADEAAKLLEALEQDAGPRQQPAGEVTGGAGRWFRVRVTDSDSGRTRVNVRMPLGVVNAGIKMGMRFAPELEGVDPQEIMSLIQSGEVGRIVDVYDDDDDEHVEIFIE
ncbi:MAG TPA: hypothetical protein VMC62_11450 [Longilinea sp.]|nr:hypothetical protein [Longilinea sp.]